MVTSTRMNVAPGEANEADPGRVVVFDFDGTLVSRDSFVDFSLRYCLARPWRMLLVCLTAPVAFVLRWHSLKAASSVLLWAMTVGGRTRGFVLALRKYGSKRLPLLANEPLWAELARRLEQGAHVVIATGTVPTIVRAMLRARGLPLLQVAGSRFRRRFGGLTVRTHCIGRVKPRELARRFGISSWLTVYTDSFADRWLVRVAREVVLVGPDERTLTRLRALVSVGSSLRVVDPRS
jgi:phosphatidylglycerophosphatase C